MNVLFAKPLPKFFSYQRQSSRGECRLKEAAGERIACENSAPITALRPKWRHRRGRTSPLIRWVGREARKDADADNGNHPIQPARSQKQIDQACDNDADQAHEQEGSKSRQVSLSSVTPDAERAEGRRQDKEHPRDRGLRVDVEDGRQRNPDKGRIEEKQSSRREANDAKPYSS